MKQINFISVILVFMTISISISSCSNSNANTIKLSETKTENTFSADSAAKWYSEHFNKFYFYVSGLNQEELFLTSKNSMTFIEEVFPEIQKFYFENMDGYDSYRNIETYIGTDGKDWIYYEKFRANGSISYFCYNSKYSKCDFCRKDVYPSEWQNIVEVNTNAKYPTPTEFDDILFNDGNEIVRYDSNYKGFKLFTFNYPRFSEDCVFIDNTLRNAEI